jgi:2-iminobutanoate/2-iminopropanoate deaminase
MSDGGKTMEEQKAISTTNAAPPAGPYNQGIRWGNMVFTASVGSKRPGQPDPSPDDFKAHTVAALENLKAILEAGGSSLDRVVKVTVYIRDIGKYAELNEVYKQYFTGTLPARAIVIVAGGGPIGFDAIGYVSE